MVIFYIFTVKWPLLCSVQARCVLLTLHFLLKESRKWQIGCHGSLTSILSWLCVFWSFGSLWTSLVLLQFGKRDTHMPWEPLKIHCLTPFSVPSMQNVYFIQSLNGLPATAPSAFPSWALAAYYPGLLLGKRCVGGRQMVRRSLGSFGSAHGSYVGAIKQKPCSIQADLNETVCLFI